MMPGNLLNRRPSMAEVRTAVRRFLEEALSDVHHVDILGLAQIDPQQGLWEAEVEVWQPNATVVALGLPTQRPVLDREHYVLRLDAELNILTFGTKQSE